MDFEVVKGFKDYSPSEQIKVNRILDIIRQNSQAYGFRPFDTPIIENFEVLAGKYEEGDEILDEIYSLSDRGSRKLGLRYDLTLPFCRFIASKKQLKLPFRRFAIGKVFRDGPIKKGRLREFTQCDCDVVGINGFEIEAELLDLFSKTYSQIGIDSIIEVNNNKILRGAFLQFGFDEKDLSSLILSVDKLKKIGIDGVLSEISQKGFDVENSKLAINLLNSKNFDEIKSFSENELLKEGILELENLTNLLEKLGVEFRINFSMSRGLDIYTGNIWEVYDKKNKISSSIGGGGRYDNLVKDFINNGKDYPCVGISFGLIPILECLNNDDEISRESLTNVLIVPLKSELSFSAFKIANDLRKKDLNVEISYSYKLKKAFSYADYIGCEKIVIFGDKDFENSTYTIKNLKTKEEEKIKFNF